jgi:hypothetical protein
VTKPLAIGPGPSDSIVVMCGHCGEPLNRVTVALPTKNPEDDYVEGDGLMKDIKVKKSELVAFVLRAFPRLARTKRTASK